MSVKVGVSSNPIPPVEFTVSQAVEAESDGYESIWYPDHLMGWFPRSLWTTENTSTAAFLASPHLYLDPVVVMGLVGQATQQISIATGVTDPIRRPPAELARTFLTLSHATKGRAILGIGAGERENVVPYGLDYRFQVARLEESLRIIRLLWESKDPVDFEGRFFKLRKAVIDLEPYEDELPPIWVGAHGPKMLAITGRYGDGWLPSYPMEPADYAERLSAVRKAADEAGRDPKLIVAGYQMYAVVADDHETSHRVLGSPLAGAMALVGAWWEWEKAGRKHPLGPSFEGLKDYVPEWYSKDEIEAAVAQYDVDVFHDLVVHGTPEEVVGRLEPFVEAGLEHIVFANLAPIAGIEYMDQAKAGLKKVAGLLR